MNEQELNRKFAEKCQKVDVAFASKKIEFPKKSLDRMIANLKELEELMTASSKLDLKKIA